MNLRWYEVPEEMATVMAERRRQGDSFSKIGRDYKIDRRVVARIVQSVEEKQSDRLLIRRDMLSRLFKSHLDDMEQAAAILLLLTAAPSLTGRLLPSYVEIEPGLVATLQSKFVPVEPGLPVAMNAADKTWAEVKERVQEHIANRKAMATVEGLRQHITDLWLQVKKWEEAANECHQGWNTLMKQATVIGIQVDSMEPSVNVAFELMSTGNQYTEEAELMQPFKQRLDGPSDVAERLLYSPPTRRDLSILRSRLDKLEGIYSELEAMLISPQLQKSLITGHCQYCPV